MRLSILSTIAAFSGLAFAQLSATQIVADTEGFIAKTEALVPTANQLSPANAVLFTIGTGPWFEVITGLTNIANTVNATTNTMGAGSTAVTYVGEDARAITDAFTTFINAQRLLLGILARKAFDLTEFSVVGPPMLDALDAIGDAVLEFADALINSLEDTAVEVVRRDLEPFEEALGSAILAYSAPL